MTGVNTAFIGIRQDSCHISWGHPELRQLGGFSGVGAIVPSFVPTECSRGRGMWGMFGKPLKMAIWNTWVCMLY